MDLATYLNEADVSFWNEMGIFTVEQYIRSGIEGEFSDAYKSARGFRPRGYDLSRFTNEQLEAIISDLYAEARDKYEAEAEWDRLDAEWREQEDKREAEAKAEADWIAKWQHHYNRLVGV